MKPHPRPLIAAAMLLAIQARADLDINVNTEMTPEGAKLVHPTPQQPAYYYPEVFGYEEFGPVARGEKAPAPLPTKKAVAQVLASQGYLVTHLVGGKLVPAPSLLLVLRWGQINPVSWIDYRKEIATPAGIIVIDERHYNQDALRKSLDLLGSRSVEPDLIMDHDMNELDGALWDGRYYLTITAYDFEAYATQKKRIALWYSRMSAYRGDLDLSGAIPVLLKAGAAYIGRATKKPVWPATPAGKVEIGEPVVKGYLPPPPTSR